MIPWLLTIELLSVSGKSLSELVGAMIERYPSSGEMNFRLTDIDSATIIWRLEKQYAHANPSKSTVDGLSLDFGDWRFNLRVSNTEPLMRLNIETQGDAALLQDKVTEISEWIEGQGGVLV